MNYQELIKMDVADLRMLAAKHGIKAHHKAKAETIAKQLVDFVTSPPPEEMKHTAQLPKEPEKINTPEQVNGVIAPFTAKEGFSVEYPPDNTWIFKFKGAEESGHMSVPLRVIRMKAESVSRGARKPVTLNFDGDRIMAVG